MSGSDVQALAVYSDFSGGEFGALGSWKAPANSFTGLNVVTYDDGSLGPRGGLKAYTLTSMPAGDVLAMGSGKTSAGALLIWFVKGTTVYAFTATNFGSQAVVTYTGAIGSAPTAGQAVSYIQRQGKTYWLNHADGKLYRFDHDAATVAAAPAAAIVTANAGAHAVLCQYGARTVAATNFSNRVFYSDPDAPESWPAANYFDVGESFMGITGAFAQRNHLSIAKGLDGHPGEWWVLTGVPGVDHVLRRQQVGVSAAAGSSVIDGDGDVWFGELFGQYPARFSGSAIDVIERLAEPSPRTYSGGFATRRPGDVVLASHQTDNTEIRLTQRRNKAWFRHRLEVGPAGYSLTKAHVAGFPGLDLVAVCADGRTGFYSWSAFANSPLAGAYTATWTPSAADRCTFALPEWWAKGDAEVALRAVQVDFRSYAMGSGNNTFTLTCTPQRLHEGGLGVAQTYSFTEAAPGADVTRRRQATWSFEFANGFQLAFSNLRGIAIQKVTAFGHLRPSQAL